MAMTRKHPHTLGSEGRRLLDQKAAAEFLGLSPATLAWWRVVGRGPTFIRISSRDVRYRARDLQDFVANCAVNPSTEDPESAR
jgi:hypothetical protein